MSRPSPAAIPHAAPAQSPIVASIPGPAQPHHAIIPPPMSTPTHPPAPPPHAARSPSVPSTGFTAVNPRHSISGPEPAPYPSMREVPPEPTMNGNPPQTQSLSMPPERSNPGQTDDWMSKFLTPSERAAGMTAETVRRETLSSTYRSSSRSETAPVIDDPLRANQQARRADSRRQSESALPEKLTDAQSSSVPIPNTPASLIPQQKPHTWNRDDGGPYKAEMISRMETMKRGERVIPPCDRCRRLHMDCIKNLTACLGCTKKHAKCSWKDVTLDELETTAPAARERAEKEADGSAPSSSEWDNMLKQTKSEPEQSQGSPATASPPTAATEPVGARSAKSSTPRIASPQNGLDRPANHHESPRLDVRPPPLDQQLRDAADVDANRPFARFAPFQRPSSQSTYQSPHQHQRSKDESVTDEGDRLAAIAGQVYRSASQNTSRANESTS